MSASSVVAAARRIVVKIGSSLATNEGRGLDSVAIAGWAGQIAELRDAHKEVLLVTSGAIAEGIKRLGWTRRPHEIHELQAAAAVGQMGLARVYESSLARYGIGTAQILLTHADLSDRVRYLNARSTLFTLLGLGIVPVINENDTVVTDEIKVGDNDTLGALVTNLVEADVLIILTDQAGLFSADPRRTPGAVLIQDGTAGDAALEAMAQGESGPLGRGGMRTKLAAARRAATSGAATVIASGREPNVLVRLAAGEKIGTELRAVVATLPARKQWMADHLKLAGQIVIDAGAVEALLAKGSSLLPIGVIEVRGEFTRGEVVSCLNEQGEEIARGIVNYGSGEARRIARRPSAEIEALLGFVEESELIHRDNLVLV